MSDSVLPERPPIASAPLSVVLIELSAGPQLEPMLRRWSAFLDGLSREYEILAVGGDDTADELRRLAKELPRLRFVRRSNDGIGAELRAGITAAQHPLVYTTPVSADQAPEDLKLFLDAIDKVDLVAGTRTGRPIPLPVRALGMIYRLLVRVFLGVPLELPPGWKGWQGWVYGKIVHFVFGGGATDVDCLHRLYRRSLFDHIPIQSDGPFASAEILAKATFQGCYLDEVKLAYPAVWPKGTSRQRWAEGWRLFREPHFIPEKPATPASRKDAKRKARKK
jgi:hypothetical protein